MGRTSHGQPQPAQPGWAAPSAWVYFCSFLSRSHGTHFFLRQTNLTNPSERSHGRNLPQKGTVTCSINSHQMHPTLGQGLHNIRENFTYFCSPLHRTHHTFLPARKRKAQSTLIYVLQMILSFPEICKLLFPLQSAQTAPIVTPLFRSPSLPPAASLAQDSSTTFSAAGSSNSAYRGVTNIKRNVASPTATIKSNR